MIQQTLDKYFQYKKDKLIKCIHYGKIWKVIRIADGKEFAMKKINIIDPTEQGNEKTQILSNNEVRVLSSLNHPNIIKYHDSFDHKNSLYIIMDYAEAGDVSMVINQFKAENLKFEEAKIRQMLAQLCLALKHLHDCNIIHRDIKIHNIFLTKSGLLKLGDFGISKQLENQHAFTSTSLGTPYYLSPEICQNKRYDQKTDIWSLGCFLFEMLSLQKPFQGDSINSLITNIIHQPPTPLTRHYSPFLTNLTYKLLSKNPQDRLTVQQIVSLPELQEQFIKLKQEFQEYQEYKFPKCTQIFPPIDLSKPMNFNLIIDSNDYNSKLQNNNQQCIQNFNYQSPNTANAKQPIVQSIINTKENTNANLKQQCDIDQNENSIMNILERARNKKNTIINKQKTPSNICKEEEGENSIVHEFNLNTDASDKSEGSQHQLSQQFTNPAESHSDQKQDENGSSTLQDYLIDATLRSFREMQNKQLVILSSKAKHKNKQCIYNELTLDTDAIDNRNESQISTDKVQQLCQKKKQFSFVGKLFYQTPPSQQRKQCVTSFLINRLGQDKFDRMRQLLEGSSDPLRVLRLQTHEVQNILGEQHKGLISMFRMLVASENNHSTINNTNNQKINKNSIKQFKFMYSTK